MLIGLISDTHGQVRPEVHEAFAGVELILHAGDVGGDDILDELATIAPVEAVFGNTDSPGHPRLQARISRRCGDIMVGVSHGHEVGRLSAENLLARYPEEVLVFGHTHRPLIVRADGRLVVNPGAAGPRRFDIQPSVALLRITGTTADVDLVSLALEGKS